MIASHPYYPQDALLSGTFHPNTWTVPLLITTFGAAWALVLGITLIAVRRANPTLKASDQALVLWFVLTGSIHLFFEGYFLKAHTNIASKNTFFAQLWKEYALSDSRYMTSDPFLLSIESWTVIIIAPLSLTTAVLIITRSNLRHPLQALTSTLHCYGNLLYFTTCLLSEASTGKAYYRPEKVYFWVYFAGMNGIWFVIPAWCLYRSISETGKAFRFQQEASEKINAKKIL